MLRRSWSEIALPQGFYNGERGEGGLIEGDRESGLVVHHLLGGGEQRWRILSMDEDPFTPPDGTYLSLDADAPNLFKTKESSALGGSGASADDSDAEKEN